MGIFLGLLLVGLGILLSYILISGQMRRKPKRSEWDAVERWERTVGRIVEHEYTIELGSGEGGYWTHTPYIYYRYTVAGATYGNDRIGPGRYVFISDDEVFCAEAEAFRREFPVGSERPVYYDPLHPQRASLAEPL